VPGVVVPAKAWEAGGAVAVSAPSGTDLQLPAYDLGGKASVVVLKVEIDPVLIDFRHVYDPIGFVEISDKGVVQRP